MQNPIPKNNLFVTPEKLEDLLHTINRMLPAERQVAYMAATLALNWANAQVQKELDTETV